VPPQKPVKGANFADRKIRTLGLLMGEREGGKAREESALSYLAGLRIPFRYTIFEISK